MSNSLDPDQARQFVGPDLGPNCLPRLTADVTGRQGDAAFILKKWAVLCSVGCNMLSTDFVKLGCSSSQG